MDDAAHRYYAKRIAYNAQYVKENYEQVQIRLAKGLRDEWKQNAARDGVSLAQYIRTCVELYEQSRAASDAE